MAYPTVSAPYGLKPINLIGGQVFAGATRQRRIASSASSIGFGDPIKFASDGTVVVTTETTTPPATGFAGVFLGCTFVSSVTGQPTWSQSWTSGTSIKANTFIYAYVCEDPDQLFQVAVVTGTTVVSTTTGLTYTNVNNNVALVANTLNTTSGDSQQAILLSSADVTATLPLRIVDLVPDTAFDYGGTTYYPEAIVKFNAPYVVPSSGTATVTGGHAYYNPVGL
jgi:hypothetical protein